MRKLRTITCLLILALTVPGVLLLRSQLPSDAQALIGKKYGGWSGVLRLWVCEDWPVGSGSAAAWINRCVASFEKRHPGVYVQPEYVDAGALTAEGLIPPDMMLFGPGCVDAGRFAPLEIEATLLDSIPRDDRAVPVMLGGYMWAWNTAKLDGIPNTWRDAGVAVALPADEPRRLWRGALLALCSSRYSEAAEPEAAPRGSIDLGLSGGVQYEATPFPGAGTLSCQFPEGFAPTADAWQAFINGDAAAMPVSQREIRRLEALSSQGRGPDWRLAAAGDAAYTDQVLYIGALRQENAEKLALCRAFANHMLSDECQRALHGIGAFAVTDAGSGYPPGDSLVEMAQMLEQMPLIVPGPFDEKWQADVEGIVRDFWADDREPAAILAAVGARLRIKPNIRICKINDVRILNDIIYR